MLCTVEPSLVRLRARGSTDDIRVRLDAPIAPHEGSQVRSLLHSGEGRFLNKFDSFNILSRLIVFICFLGPLFLQSLKFYSD